jgi:putative transposase
MAGTLFEEFPRLRQRCWGPPFWARGSFCATVGEISEEMIKEYLEHHFEQDLPRISGWNPRRVLNPYPDFQSLPSTHRL